MSAISFRDKNGTVHDVLFIKGKDGKDGKMSFDELTDAQKKELAGLIGDFTVDQELNEDSPHAVSNKAVTAETTRLFNIISGSTYELNEEIIAIGRRLDDAEMNTSSAISGASEAHVRLDAVEEQIGSIDTALDGILAIQNALIGGGAE